MSVLGLPLDEAVSRLEGAGFTVQTVETRSMKGVEAPDSLRVVRQTELEGCDKPTILLVYSAFRTSVYPQNAEQRL